MMTSEDITRVKRGPADLEERIEQLIKQKEILKSACKMAGKRIEELEGEISIIRGIGMNSPEMRAAKARIEDLERDREIFKKELDRLSEENDNLRTMMGKL